MTEAYRQLAASLRERIDIIGDEESRKNPAQHMARLQKVSETIEQIEQRLSPSVHPQLRHFLQQRSYTKALAFLETPR